MAAIDFDRIPTKVYDTVRRSFEPVAALFQYPQDRWKSGEPFHCSLWAVNDRWEAMPGSTLHWRIVGPGGKACSEGSIAVELPADSSLRVGEAAWTTASPGAYQLRAELTDPQGRRIAENIFEFQVVQ